MARVCYVQINGELIDKSDHEAIAKARGYSQPQAGSATFVPDLPDFVSPIDGKLYSGRAGMREHCNRHNVVSNLELKGLPTLQMNSDQRSASQVRQDNASRKERIINLVNNHYR
jgi:hypothetical protein